MREHVTPHTHNVNGIIQTWQTFLRWCIPYIVHKQEPGLIDEKKSYSEERLIKRLV